MTFIITTIKLKLSVARSSHGMRHRFDTENILKPMTQCWIVQSGPHVIICLLLDALASLDGMNLIICNKFFNISEEKKLFISISDWISDKTWAQLGLGGARISLKQMGVEVTSDIDHTSLLVKLKSCFVAHPMTGLLGFGSVVICSVLIFDDVIYIEFRTLLWYYSIYCKPISDVA